MGTWALRLSPANGIAASCLNCVDTIWTRCLRKLLKKKENTDGPNPSLSANIYDESK